MVLTTPRRLPVIGWREWLSLPDLGVVRIKAKVDTGARSSALHAVGLEPFGRSGEPWIRFRIHPRQRSSRREVIGEAPLVDERRVRSSSGRTSLRPVIRTQVGLGHATWSIEITLVDRDVMGFRMLLGRSAIRRRFLVDCGRSYLGEKAARQPSSEENSA